MNIADYFKMKPDKPIDALIEDLKDNSTTTIIIKESQDKTETDALLDNILGKDEPLPIQ